MSTYHGPRSLAVMRNKEPRPNNDVSMSLVEDKARSAVRGRRITARDAVASLSELRVRGRSITGLNSRRVALRYCMGTLGLSASDHDI